MNRAIRDMVRTKEFGKIKMIDAMNCQNQGDPGQWRQNKQLSGGGALPDIGIYCLNTIRAMLGEEPDQVFATTFIEALYQSAAQGKPISLPRIDGLEVYRGPQPENN